MVRMALAFLLSTMLLGCESDSPAGPETFDPTLDWKSVKGDPSHTLRLIRPNGGDVFKVGSQIEIAGVFDTVGIDLDIEMAYWYSHDGGNIWTPVGDRSYKIGEKVILIVPDSVEVTEYDASKGEVATRKFSALTSTWKFRVSEYNGEGMRDDSDGLSTVSH